MIAPYYPEPKGAGRRPAGLWRRHWLHRITLFDYPDEIRNVIYTTNAIVSLNSLVRKAVNSRKLFPSDASA